MKFNISQRIFDGIFANENNLRERASNGKNINLKVALHPKHPELESRVADFVAFTKTNRIPVSKRLVQENAVMTAEALGSTEFKSSNGWLEEYLR